MKVTYYRNLKNPNKFLEVHNDGHYHNSVRQFMYWKNAGVKNMIGDCFLHRWRKHFLEVIGMRILSRKIKRVALLDNGNTSQPFFVI